MKLEFLISFILTLISLANSLAVKEKQYLYARQNNTGGGGGATNNTNGTTPGGGGSGTTVPVFVVGGSGQVSGSAQKVSNSSGTFNFTQLSQISSQISSSLQSNNVVIMAKSNSMESIAFFSSIVFNSNNTVVICEDSSIGQIVASDSNSTGRGSLIVSKKNVIYSGTLPPWGVPVGVIGDDNKAHWFTNSCPPLLIAPNSTLRTTFTNFTNTNFTTAPTVPIVYQEGISATLLSSVGALINGLVVISTGSNSTSSSTNSTVPIVYAQPQGRAINYVSNSSIPSSAIAGGYMSPVQAQILLSIALANGVNSTESLKSIFST